MSFLTQTQWNSSELRHVQAEKRRMELRRLRFASGVHKRLDNQDYNNSTVYTCTDVLRTLLGRIYVHVILSAQCTSLRFNNTVVRLFPTSWRSSCRRQPLGKLFLSGSHTAILVDEESSIQACISRLFGIVMACASSLAFCAPQDHFTGMSCVYSTL